MHISPTFDKKQNNTKTSNRVPLYSKNTCVFHWSLIYTPSIFLSVWWMSDYARRRAQHKPHIGPFCQTCMLSSPYHSLRRKPAPHPSWISSIAIYRVPLAPPLILHSSTCSWINAGFITFILFLQTNETLFRNSPASKQAGLLILHTWDKESVREVHDEDNLSHATTGVRDGLHL